jgi:hypothetical protein
LSVERRAGKERRERRERDKLDDEVGAGLTPGEDATGGGEDVAGPFSVGRRWREGGCKEEWSERKEEGGKEKLGKARKGKEEEGERTRRGCW